MKSVLKEYFLNSLRCYPEMDALEVKGRKFSYRSFNEIVSSLTFSIQKEKINNKAIVVLNDHSVYSYAGILAVLFSGNAVLPLETSWPKQRIEDIVDQAKPAAVLLSDKNRETENILSSIEQLNAACQIDAVSGELLRESCLKSAGEYKDIAYIIFTSGSTGSPKGVPVKTESLDAFLEYYRNNYDFTSSDRFLQVYDITFDVAYFSFFVPLCCGACCCVINSREGVPRFLSIVDDLLKRKITVVSMVPTVLPFIRKYIRKGKAQAVRYSFFSGDALYQSDAIGWQKFVSNAAIHNCYGPTETTIVCTRYVWEEAQAAKELYHDIVPIGKPFPGMQFKIVNEENVEVEKGAIGELSFSGAQVIDRYLCDGYTERFFCVEVNDVQRSYYKTGDLASLNQYGNLIFHGRKDHQVKINGYRIELEEVQLALQKLTGLQCVVVKKEGLRNINYLKAFICGGERDIEELKKELCEFLPHYMIPTEIAFISQMPLLENGKIDKSYLQHS
jgi:amino acid adenylation domain-containing protein